MDDALTGMERAAKQLSNFDVDVIFQSGVPPVVARGAWLCQRIAGSAGAGLGLSVHHRHGRRDRRHAREQTAHSRDGDAVPAVHQRPVGEISRHRADHRHHNKALGIERNTEIRRLPIPVEYQTARKAFLEAPGKPDGLYIPCGGWGCMHNIEPLEQDLDTTVITWMNVMIWSAMRRGKVTGPIKGFGKLLASL